MYVYIHTYILSITHATHTNAGPCGDLPTLLDSVKDRVYTHIYACVCTLNLCGCDDVNVLQMLTNLHTYMHTYMHTHPRLPQRCRHSADANQSAYIHTYIHTYMLINLHTYAHTYMHTHLGRLSDVDILQMLIYLCKLLYGRQRSTNKRTPHIGELFVALFMCALCMYVYMYVCSPHKRTPPYRRAFRCPVYVCVMHVCIHVCM
jgi:hypothetical protein